MSDTWREVAYFLKCDWLAFLRYSGVGRRIWAVIIVLFAGSKRNSACKSQIKAMPRPFRWKVLEYCAVADYTSRSYSNASVCSSTVDFHKTGERKGRSGDGGGGGAASIISAFSVQDLLFLLPGTFRERPTRTKTIQRRRHIGSRKKSLFSPKPPCCGGGSLSGVTVQQNCYSNSFSDPCGLQLSSAPVGGWDTVRDVLVDPLEALRVLHRHEEFLSQVFEWLVSRQVQAVKTGEKKHPGQRLDRFPVDPRVRKSSTGVTHLKNPLSSFPPLHPISPTQHHSILTKVIILQSNH